MESKEKLAKKNYFSPYSNHKVFVERNQKAKSSYQMIEYRKFFLITTFKFSTK